MTNDTIYTAIKNVLLQFPCVEVCILYGSAAHDNLSPSSDIDIALSSNTIFTAERKLSIIKALSNHTGRAVDLIDLKNASPILVAEILKTGKRIIGNDTQYGQLISRHIMDYEDFRILLQSI